MTGSDFRDWCGRDGPVDFLSLEGMASQRLGHVAVRTMGIDARFLSPMFVFAGR